MRFIPTRRWRNTWAVRVVLAVALVLAPTMGAASSCGPAPSKSSSNSTATATSNSAAGGGGGTVNGEGAKKCAAAQLAKPGSSCCVVGTSQPFAEKGVVTAHTITECDVPPEVFNIEVYLKWGIENQADDYEIVDQCSQWEPSDLGQKCTVATSCKPGYYEVVWDMQVTVNGVESSDRENGGDYQKYISYDTCKATRAT